MSSSTEFRELSMGADLTKDEIRSRLWNYMEAEDLVSFPRPCFGRIPNFKGAELAAERIKELVEFRRAKCVFCAPDGVLKRVRELVLEQGKVLVVALPHMKDFLEITEQEKIKAATKIKGFTRFGKPLQTRVDLFVQGSVAVDRLGNRLGKGAGYGDQEWDYLLKRQLINPGAKVITVVHDCQIVDDMSGLMGKHDKRVDYILTPTKVIVVGTS